MKLTISLVAILSLFCFRASAQHKNDSSYTQALAEAKRLGDTDAGKAYDGEFGKVVAPQLSGIVNECTKNLGPRVNFEVVFIFAADGRVQDVLTASDQPGAKCVGEKLRNLQLPPPPRAGWPVQLGIHISPDNVSKVHRVGIEVDGNRNVGSRCDPQSRSQNANSRAAGRRGF